MQRGCGVSRSGALGLERLSSITAELVIYIAGADPYTDDRWPPEHDHVGCWSAPAGVEAASPGRGRHRDGRGYAREIDDTVDIHFNTIQWRRSAKRSEQG